MIIKEFEFESYADDVFATLRHAIGIGESTYIGTVAPSNLPYLEFISNSKSGQDFFLRWGEKRNNVKYFIRLRYFSLCIYLYMVSNFCCVYFSFLNVEHIHSLPLRPDFLNFFSAMICNSCSNQTDIEMSNFSFQCLGKNFLNFYLSLVAIFSFGFKQNLFFIF